MKPFDTSAFLDDDEVVAEYLTAALEDSNPDVFLAAVGQVAKSRGMSAVAESTGLGRAPAKGTRGFAARVVFWLSEPALVVHGVFTDSFDKASPQSALELTVVRSPTCEATREQIANRARQPCHPAMPSQPAGKSSVGPFPPGCLLDLPRCRTGGDRTTVNSSASWRSRYCRRWIGWRSSRTSSTTALRPLATRSLDGLRQGLASTRAGEYTPGPEWT